MWTWLSMPPGRTSRPEASISRAAPVIALGERRRCARPDADVGADAVGRGDDGAAADGQVEFSHVEFSHVPLPQSLAYRARRLTRAPGRGLRSGGRPPRGCCSGPSRRARRRCPRRGRGARSAGANGSRRSGCRSGRRRPRRTIAAESRPSTLNEMVGTRIARSPTARADDTHVVAIAQIGEQPLADRLLVRGDGVEGALDGGAVAGAAAERVEVVDDAGAAPGEFVVACCRARASSGTWSRP